MVNHVVWILGSMINAISALMVIYVVVWSLLQTFNANPLHHFLRVWLQLILYYAGFTMPWWLMLAIMAGVSGWLSIWPAIVIAVLAASYYLFTVVLPSQLRTQEQEIDLGLETPWRIAVLGNLKVGLYSGKARHIKRWVNSLNQLDVDAIFITGDWLYHPGADLLGQLMLFKAVNKPVYTVMSRTDLVYQFHSLSKQGQPLLEDTLSSAFRALDIIDISQQCLLIDDPSTLLCGWQDEEATSLIAKRSHTVEQPTRCPVTKKVPVNVDSKANIKATENKNHQGTSLSEQIATASGPVIVLAAHFDRVYELPQMQPRPLVIAGDGRSSKLSIKANTATNATSAQIKHHSASSEGANIRPIASRHPLLPEHQGLHQHELAQVFVAHSVGTSRWPFRLSIPTIDVLKIH